MFEEENHNCFEGEGLTCTDFYHKLAIGYSTNERDGGFDDIKQETNPQALNCPNYQKCVAPIEKGCKCCGRSCVEKITCDYNMPWNKSKRGSMGECQTICEDFGINKEISRKESKPEISRSEYYALLKNKPKSGFDCSHFKEYSTGQKDKEICQIMHSRLIVRQEGIDRHFPTAEAKAEARVIDVYKTETIEEPKEDELDSNKSVELEESIAKLQLETKTDNLKENKATQTEESTIEQLEEQIKELRLKQLAQIEIPTTTPGNKK